MAAIIVHIETEPHEDLLALAEEVFSALENIGIPVIEAKPWQSQQTQTSPYLFNPDTDDQPL